MSALVLRLLGVSDDDIVADYLRTAENMDRIKDRFRSWPRYRDHIEKVPAEVYEARADTIQRFLVALDRDHGGARGWAGARGIGTDDIGRLRDGLLVPRR